MLIGNSNGNPGGQPGPVGPSTGYPNQIPGIYGGHHSGSIHTCSYNKQKMSIYHFNLYLIIQILDVHCKDNSPRCTTMPAKYCNVPIEADFCRRSCGLCYANHGLPPLHLRG